MPSEYRFRRRVQFYETDAAGIVHFSWFFRYMEEAEHALWREAGLSIASPDSEIGWPRVAASFDYHSALRFEQEFDVQLRVAALTKKTIRYTCLLTRDGTKVATGSLTVVCVRRQPNQQMKAIEIPPEIAALLSAGRRRRGLSVIGDARRRDPTGRARRSRGDRRVAGAPLSAAPGRHRRPQPVLHPQARGGRRAISTRRRGVFPTISRGCR